MEPRVKRTEVIRNRAQKMQNPIEMEYRMKEPTEMEHIVYFTGAKKKWCTEMKKPMGVELRGYRSQL
jgi:hypothetical protein